MRLFKNISYDLLTEFYISYSVKLIYGAIKSLNSVEMLNASIEILQNVYP